MFSDVDCQKIVSDGLTVLMSSLPAGHSRHGDQQLPVNLLND